MENNTPFCYAPWVGLNIRGTIEDFKPEELASAPCCAWLGQRYYGKISEIDNSALWTEIKNDMTNHNMEKLSKTCVECIEAEKSNKMSARLNFKSRVDMGYLKIGYINWLDIRTSNLCNLKCIICSASSSSMIAKEEGKLFRNVPLDDLYKLDFSELKMLRVLGGEPTLQGNALDLIDYIATKAKNCDLGITSNATNVNDKLIAKCLPYRNVFYNLSIDGTDKTFEYVRKNANWKSVLENIIYLQSVAEDKDNFHVRIHCTLGAVNFVTVCDWIQWFIDSNLDVYFEFANGSENSINCIPNQVKDRVIKELSEINHPYAEEIIKMAKSKKYNSDDNKAFIKHINKKDKLRNTNILNLHPDFKEVMNA